MIMSCFYNGLINGFIIWFSSGISQLDDISYWFFYVFLVYHHWFHGDDHIHLLSIPKWGEDETGTPSNWGLFTIYPAW